MQPAACSRLTTSSHCIAPRAAQALSSKDTLARLCKYAQKNEDALVFALRLADLIAREDDDEAMELPT